jgi:ElaB/YqjD/DUF883 family membrane-anchored ribosome-binding protein
MCIGGAIAKSQRDRFFKLADCFLDLSVSVYQSFDGDPLTKSPWRSVNLGAATGFVLFIDDLTYSSK